jgi:hypothetical protein
VRRRAHARGALQVWNRYPSPQCFKERLQKDVVNKSLSPNQEEAVIERMVTYNYAFLLNKFLTDIVIVHIYYVYTTLWDSVAGPERTMPGNSSGTCWTASFSFKSRDLNK